MSSLSRKRQYSALFITWFALLVGLNWPHFGTGAELHWDAEDAVCTDDPMPAKAAMLAAGGHAFDLVTELKTADPATLTARFDSGAEATHAHLMTVRRYYSEVAFMIGRAAFDLGRSPVAAVWCFQLAGALMMSVVWSAATMVVVAKSTGRSRMVMLAVLVAAATSPVGLSLARQVLTETVGLLFMVVTLGLVSRLNRSSIAVAVGIGLFLTIRSRYSLGPTVVLLGLPLASSRLRAIAKPQAARLVAIVVVTFVVIAILDYVRSGPFLLPWVYDRWMVRPTRLYFHATPPYHLFAIGLYETVAMWLLPAVVVLGRSTGGRYARFALAVFILLLVMTARQEVAFQGRHLVPMVVGITAVMGVVGRPLAAAGRLAGDHADRSECVFDVRVTGTQADGAGPPAVRRPSVGGRSPVRRAAVEVVAAYYDWADENRVHDPLTAAAVLATVDHPVVLIDPFADDRSRLAWFCRRFQLAEVVRIGSRTAVPTDRPVFDFGRPGIVGSPVAKRSTGRP